MNIYGHIHSNRKAAYWDVLQNMEDSLNACVEVNGYQPAMLAELRRNNLAFWQGMAGVGWWLTA